MNFETVTLEDGITYAIVMEKENYLYLANIDNAEDFCIRKNVLRDGKEYIETLDNEQEFQKALALFTKK